MERLFHYIDENKDLYIGWLQELCRIPSVAAQNRRMEEAANKVLHDLQVYTKASARLIETKGFPVVFGEIKGKTSRTLSFYNHYDVQPEDPVELWDVEPLAAVIVEG